MCTCFISLMNMEKVPEIDLEGYVESYQMASQNDLLTFLVFGHDEGRYGFIKEPLYWILTWGLNRLYDGNVKMFLFTISVIIYMPMVLAMISFGKAVKLQTRYIIIGVVFLCFFPYIFSATMNLVRQSIATSILCYVAVKHYLYGKREWIWIISMPLFHLSSLLFIPILMLTPFMKPYKEKKIWYITALLSLLVIQFLAGFMSSLGIFSDESSTSYALNRVQHEVGQYDGLSLFSLTETIAILSYSAYLFFFNKLANPKLSGFLFLLVFLGCYIVSILNNHMMSGRYIHYLFTFMPFLLIIFFSRSRIDKYFLLAISVGVIIALTVYLHVGLWTFNVTMGGWLTPIFGYLV